MAMARHRTTLISIGDEMSELNIQRRLQWLRETDPECDIYFTQELFNKDPAIRRAIEELHWLKVR